MSSSFSYRILAGSMKRLKEKFDETGAEGLTDSEYETLRRDPTYSWLPDLQALNECKHWEVEVYYENQPHVQHVYHRLELTPANLRVAAYRQIGALLGKADLDSFARLQIFKNRQSPFHFELIPN